MDNVVLHIRHGSFALISRTKEPGGFDRVRRRIDGSVSSSLYFSPGLIPYPSTGLFHGKILRREEQHEKVSIFPRGETSSALDDGSSSRLESSSFGLSEDVTRVLDATRRG